MRAATFALALAVLVGCGAEVSGPGSVLDEELNRPEAQQALVNGAARTVAAALNFVAFTGSAITFEIVGAGSEGLFGITALQRERGILDPGATEADPHWQRTQQGRWVSEDAVRRLRGLLGEAFSSSSLGAQALLYAGHANRILGENMCHAVIDGGAAQPQRVSFERAEAAFSEALEIAERAGDSETALAAHAGRAAARVGLGDWAGAVADAQVVPDPFVFQARFSAIELDQYNRIFWGNANQPFRAHSVWSTFYETYYLETGDPRTPWVFNPDVPKGTRGVTWYAQTKYQDRGSPINLSSGREMRLIEAEARLRGGDAVGALAILTALRTSVGVAPWTATTLEDTWTALKRERGIELWLEGRRLWDLRRWLEEATPGVVEDITGRSTCFPIGQTELDTNPRLLSESG